MTRLNKFLSEAGICSRREADRWIEAKRLLVNGQIALMGTKVSPSDVITLDGSVIFKDNPSVYLAYHKPVGIICTTDINIKGNIVDAINYHTRIFHIGRLDKDSEGLILMTNDGDIVNKILRAENFHEKEYIVTVDKVITLSFIQNMSRGVKILNTVTRPCKVKQLSPHTFSIILTEGLNRQIRRMCGVFDYQVLTLKRIRIMHITLDIPVGKYRALNPHEEKRLFELLKH